MAPPIRLASLMALAWASLLIYAAGCGGTDATSSSTITMEPASATITLRSSGGYPPFSHEITITPDGSARSVSKQFDAKADVQTFDVSDEDLASIQSELDDLDIGSLDLPAGSDCCDLVYYELGYGEETIKADVTNIPPALSDAVDHINGLEPIRDQEPTGESGGDAAVGDDIPPPR